MEVLTPPIPPNQNILSDKEYNALKAQAANYRTILSLLKASGIDDFLTDRNMLPISLILSPDDMQAGNSINIFLKSIADECNRMDQKIISLSQALVDSNISLAQEKRKNLPIKPIFKWIYPHLLQSR